MTATFTKNKYTGQYDVIGEAGIVRPGARVKVQRRNGSITTVDIEKTGKAFVAKFGPLKGKRVVIGKLARAGSVKGMEPCDECGKPGALIECKDSSGLPGLCCGNCSKMPAYQRSFA